MTWLSSPCRKQQACDCHRSSESYSGIRPCVVLSFRKMQLGAGGGQSVLVRVQSKDTWGLLVGRRILATFQEARWGIRIVPPSVLAYC